MTRILQSLVWITVMTAPGRTQRGHSHSYLQNPQSITFPDTRPQAINEQSRNRQTEQNIYSDLQDPRRQRIQNRVSELRRPEHGFSSRIQLSKRGGHRKHYITKLFLELFEALGAIEPDSSSIVVFPGPTSKSRFEPEISDDCKKRGYCKRIPNYPVEKVKELLGTLGDDVRLNFQMDELDTNDVQIEQRFGPGGYPISLCNATEEIIIPDSLPDKNNQWWTVLQDRDNNMTQGFRAEHCNESDGNCNPLISFPKNYENRCVQKYVYRTVLIVEQNKAVAQRSLKIPSCCSCIATAPF